MAVRRLHGRFIGAALTVGPLLIQGIIWAGPARADQATFLDDLHNAGIHAVNGGDDALLQMGAELCQQLSWAPLPRTWKRWPCNAPMPTRARAGSTVDRPQT